MFYQILLFMPLKIVFGAFFSFLFLSFTAFFSFSSSHEVEEGSLVSGHVCLRTPPEGGRAGRLRHKQIHQKKKKRAGPEPSAPPRHQINGGRTWKPAGSAAGPPVWEWSSLMDRDVHLASTRHALAHLRVLLHLSLLPPASSCAQPRAGCL